MEIQNLTTKIIFLFIPGIIMVLMEQRNTSTIEKSPLIIIFKCIAYGVFSYFVLHVVYCIHNICGNTNYYSVDFFNILIEDDFSNMDFLEVFHVSLIALILSTLMSMYTNTLYECNNLAYVLKCKKELKYNKKEFHNLQEVLNFIYIIIIQPIILFFSSISNVFRIKRKLSNNDVWNYVLTNYGSPVIVRDWENMRVYYGEIALNSVSSSNSELFLNNVKIMDMLEGTSREVSSIYLSKSDASSWDIEFPNNPNYKRNLILTTTSNYKLRGKRQQIRRLINQIQTDNKLYKEIDRILYKIENNKSNSNKNTE